MKNSLKSLLVAAAVTGLLGAAVIPAAADDTKPAAQTEKDKTPTKAKAKKASSKDKKAAKDAKDKNSCKAANGCSAKDEKK
jgi:lipopolysaccharide export LptBFGC system permease protein LptF